MSEQDPGQLDAETRALLRTARGMDEPTESQRSRVQQGLELKLAAAVATTAYASTSFAATAKLAMVTVALGVASTGVWYAARPTTPSQTARSRAVQVQAPERQAAPESQALAPEPTLAPREAEAEPSVHKARPRRPARTPRVEATLTAETELLREVHAAIGRGDGTQALTLLASYDKRFKSGLLREEKSAARVLALCVAGQRDRARSEASRFVSRFPRSPLIARLNASCAADASKVAP
jgi:hypothetical protein